MSYGAYVYVADNGTSYTVNVPSDFATSLGMTASSGQPSLPQEIAPRYAYFSGTDGSSRAAVVQTTALLATIVLTTYTVSGITFTCTAAQGQYTPPLQSFPLNGAMLVQGPAGTSGTNGTNGVPSSIVAWSSLTTYVPGNGVYYNGSSYLCTASNTNEVPPNSSYWQIIAEAGSSGSSVLTLLEGTISSAQLLSMFSSPVTLIAAPGANKVLQIDSAVYRFVPGGTQYSGGGNLQSEFGSTNAAAVFTAAQIQGTTTELIDSDISFGDSVAANYVNQPFGLYMLTANPTLGTGVVNYSIAYRVCNV
jgi:hypothetical protein